MGVSKRAAEGAAFAVAIDLAFALVAGKPASTTGAATPTPLTSLLQQLSGPSSAADAGRDRGGQVDAMPAASREADSIDDFWNR